MYKLEKTNFGIKMTVRGFLSEEEAKNWSRDAIKMLDDMPEQFNVLIDMRGFKVGSKVHVKAGIEIENEFIRRGLQKSAVVFDSIFTLYQSKSMAKETGLEEKYFDITKDPDSESKAIKWITQ